MERKGLAKYDDYRIIFKSEQIVNSPIAMLSDLPAELKTAISKAILAFPEKEPEAFKKMTDGKQLPWVAVTHDAYKPIIELNKFVDDLRKKKAS